MRRRGFTLIELAAILAVGGTLVCVGALGTRQPTQDALKAARDAARTKKDEAQIRGLHQAFVVWAQNNRDLYPLPSRVDKADATVSENGAAKDTSANIYSMLVFTGLLSTDMLVSPREVNLGIVAKKDYQFDKPKTAVNPAKALWDPSLSVDLLRKANASYSHLQPSGGRLARWTNSFKSNEMVLSTRTPEVREVAQNPDGTITPTLAKPSSNTLRIHGNSVVMARDLLKSGRAMPKGKESVYTAKDGKSWVDLWCYNEPDDDKNSNNFLGLFVKAGADPKDFKPTWD
jgi:hypothetical protein